MNKKSTPEEDLASIRLLMERSTRFISLSGLSGVLAGVYALAGSAFAYMLIYYPNTPFGFRFYFVNEQDVLVKLIVAAAVVLILSIATGFLFTVKKSKKLSIKYWDHNSRRFLINTAIPLIAGGVFIITLLLRGYLGIVAPASLLFYGLALISGSVYTLGEIRYLGLCQVALGLISAMLPGYGLIFWSLGFGVLHIVYGIVMHNKYDR